MVKKYKWMGSLLLVFTLAISACSTVSAQVPSPTSSKSEVRTQVPGLIAATATPFVAGSPDAAGDGIVPVAGSQTLTVTSAENGKTITLQIGDRFALKLGEDPYWTVSVADPAVVSRVVNILTVRGVQGIYEAHQVGRTTLTANNSATGARFRLDVVVQGQATSTSASGQAVAFNQIHMVTSSDGWALGAPLSGVQNTGASPATSAIYHTEDGGQVWQNVTPENVTLNRFALAFFLNASQAWLVNSDIFSNGGSQVVVYHTLDAGATWIRGETTQINNGYPIGVEFLADGRNGWLTVTSGPGAGSEPVSLYRSNDGGITWQLISEPQNGQRAATPGSLPVGCIKSGIVFSTPNDGWATGSCPGGPMSFFKSSDGGQTWQRASLPVPQGYPANSFSDCQCALTTPEFVTSQAGFLGLSIFQPDKQEAFLYLTHDAGQTWKPLSLPVSQLPAALDFASLKDGWLLDGQQTLYVTHDGGSSWQSIGKLPVETVFGGLDFTNAQDGFLTNGIQVFVTHDGGVNWNSFSVTAVPEPGLVTNPPAGNPTPTPRAGIPIPSSEHAIAFAANAVSDVFTTRLQTGQPIAYRIHVLPKQYLLVTANGEVKFQIFNPQRRPVSHVISAPGPLVLKINQNGSYHIAFEGQGKLTFSVYVTPLANNSIIKGLVPASPQRIRFAPGGTSVSVSTQMQRDKAQAYVLRARAGQTMLVSTQGDVTVILFDPNGALLNPVSAQLGEWHFNLPQNGDYDLILLGQKTVSMKVRIPQ
jgi:photosystem II stability/assembly factor-like uncharacterized protein